MRGATQPGIVDRESSSERGRLALILPHPPHAPRISAVDPSYFSASGFTGEPKPPVTSSGGAESMKL